VNLVLREENALVGENTEGKGVVQAMRALRDLAATQVVLLGAGRMARAIAVELATAGVAGITVVNRDEDHAGELAAMLAGKFSTPVSVVSWQGDYVVPPEADILINATPLSHAPQQNHVPLVLESLQPKLLVADVAADSPHNRLLVEAAQRGCSTVDGLSMFIEQVAIGFQLWTGVAPDRAVLREAVEEFWEL
jgi:shikimate dehydrogenase